MLQSQQTFYFKIRKINSKTFVKKKKQKKKLSVYSKTRITLSDSDIVAWLFTEYDVAWGILKFQCKTWEFRITSYSVNSQAIIPLNSKH